MKEFVEPAKTLNGVTLSVGQAMTLRVAIESMSMGLLGDTAALGIDLHGVTMRAQYLARLVELRGILFRTVEPPLTSS